MRTAGIVRDSKATAVWFDEKTKLWHVVERNEHSAWDNYAPILVVSKYTGQGYVNEWAEEFSPEEW